MKRIFTLAEDVQIGGEDVIRSVKRFRIAEVGEERKVIRQSLLTCATSKNQSARLLALVEIFAVILVIEVADVEKYWHNLSSVFLGERR